MTKVGLIAVIVVGAIGIAILTPHSASAISAELAKKCRGLALKAYPPPPTGSKSGNAGQMRGYYANCLAHDGNVPESTPSQGNNAAQPTQKR